MLARRPETKNYDISSLKYIMCGAAPLSRDLQNEVSDRFGFRITQGWGYVLPFLRVMFLSDYSTSHEKS